MVDIDTVMSWLDGLSQPDWREYHSDSEVQNIAKVALELLKEKEAEVEIEGGGSTWFYVCGECHTSVSKHSKYCRECGRRLKWENITLK